MIKLSQSISHFLHDLYNHSFSPSIQTLRINNSIHIYRNKPLKAGTDNQPDNMASLAQIKDPLASLVGSLAQELVMRFKEFGDRCRLYTMQQAENPQFTRMLMQSSPTVTKQVVERKQTLEERPQRPRRRDMQDVPLKKPRNAYNLFVASESVKIKEQNPHMRAPDIVRVAAERYNSMTPEQKRPYIEKFEEAKRLYEEQQNDLSRSGAPPRRGRGGFGRGARYDYTLK